MTRGSSAAHDHGPSGRVVAVYLVAAACLAASITILFLSMRAVLNVGGFCAEGGPYEVAVHCPEGVVLLTPLGFIGGMASAFVVFAAGDAIGGGFGALAMLAWPAVFISLGWNFLENGIAPPPEAGGPVISWIVCGIIFWIMGGAPLVAALGMVGASGRRPRGEPPAVLAAAGSRRPESPLGTSSRPEPPAGPGGPLKPDVFPIELPPAGLPDEALAADLERLAALHRSGALDDAEFSAAKRGRIGGGPLP